MTLPQAFTGNEVKEIDGTPTLLSVDEVNKYFKSDNDRICMPTLQAVNDGAWTWDDNGACGWWLRSPGAYSDYAADVYADGLVYPGGLNVDYTANAVRPALWVNL